MEYKFNLNLKEVLPTQGTININGQDNDDDIVIKKIEFIDSDINVFFILKKIIWDFRLSF
ncbi:hypothetical protein AS222_08075 [Enterococcus faecium]|uniref:hypothetical protein n=1 Tax=Enterococcus faecium TaxID=1352 RepID=UPI000453B519|nr:hypothetical protein [Enterococcus faecium]EZP95522.1 hypothetical protein Z974_11825 [Enterococcus faecium VRE1261]KWX90375.1 hypothetical protein AS222_08075 [Enterococcus faecium]KXH18340.1 hypothetical protein AS278_11790 [Enterococcus faecium]